MYHNNKLLLLFLIGGFLIIFLRKPVFNYYATRRAKEREQVKARWRAFRLQCHGKPDLGDGWKERVKEDIQSHLKVHPSPVPESWRAYNELQFIREAITRFGEINFYAAVAKQYLDTMDTERRYAFLDVSNLAEHRILLSKSGITLECVRMLIQDMCMQGKPKAEEATPELPGMNVEPEA